MTGGLINYALYVLFHRWTQCCVDRFGNAHRVTDVWTHIESRQFIGWWRDANSDAMTSSAHTGERTIHSSDFSAFTKQSHYPSLLRFSGPTYLFAIIHLHFGDCLSGTLFSSRWSAMEFRRCQPPCARFIAREDPHSKCIKCLGFSHARDAVYGTSKCKICDDVELEEMESEQTGLAFSLPCVRANSAACEWGENEESRFTVTGRGQTAEAFLPAPNALSSLKSVTATLRGLVCRSSSPSFLLGLAVGGRVRLSPFAARPFAAGEPHVRRHSCFSPAVYGTRAGHPSAQHFSLHHPEDAEGSPSRWRVPLLSGLLDTPS